MDLVNRQFPAHEVGSPVEPFRTDLAIVIETVSAPKIPTRAPTGRKPSHRFLPALFVRGMAMVKVSAHLQSLRFRSLRAAN